MQEVVAVGYMYTIPAVKRRLLPAFTEQQADLLAEVVVGAYQDLVKTSDFNELKAIVKELAQAQQRTERRVEELAVAQQKTEAALQQLVQDHRETRRQLGGLSATVGYRLEDEAFKALPLLLERDWGLLVQGRLKRSYVTGAEGSPLEINIIGQALRDGKAVTIVGESKSQLSTNDVDRFVRRKLKRLEGVFAEVFPLLVTYMVSAPDVEEYARQQGVAVYYSYDF